jgi:hypothetical protein
MADSEEWSDSVTPFTVFVGCVREIMQVLRSSVLKYWSRREILSYWVKVVLGSSKFFRHESFKVNDDQIRVLAENLV